MDVWTVRGAAVAASALLAFAAPAQGLLPAPPSHVATEGTAATNVPFGRSTPTRAQYVYDAVLFSGPVTITGVQLRLDGGAVTAAKTVDCEISLSTLPHPLVQLSAQFAQNRGADEVAALPRQLLSLPAQSSGGTPSPFLAPIAFATPFSYDPQSGGLVMEIAVHGQPPGAYALDVTYVCSSPMVAVGPASCAQSNGLPLGVESVTTGVQWGRPWIVRGFDALPGEVVVLALGTQESGSWAGLQLPQDLAVAGAAGCYLSIDIAASFYDVAAADGSTTFAFSIPNNPQVLGEWMRFQAGAFDAAANSLGLVTSQAHKVQICGWEPVGRVWASGASASVGVVELGLSAVVQFTTQ
jgi:hypothetical protein